MSGKPEKESETPTGVATGGAGVWAAMSHEIRTPLMGVVGMLEILSRTSLTDEQRRIIATVGESSMALMRIVDDVLDLAKLESARSALTPVATDLVDLLESCTELLANQAESKNLAITCEVPFDVPPVMCDALRLRQVLLNLGINAIKFTETGHIALSARVIASEADTATIRFTIADSGIGIPADLHAFLFQPFSQLAVGTGRGLGGVGLGLAICRNLVEAMGGKITVDSASGKGTRFYVDVTFPKTGPEFGTPQIPSLEGLSVVAVDAGEPGLQIALAYFEGAGARVQRFGALNSLGGNTLTALQRSADTKDAENLVVVIGPDAEPEDVEAATATLQGGMSPAKVPVLWLHPRAVGGALSLARRGVRAVRAHPIRRAALLSAIAGARAFVEDFSSAPVLTRHLSAKPFASHDEEAAATARAEGRVILVAEDNIVNQQVLRQQLAILGFDCDIAGGGAAALQALRERPYLVLLCDCHMPGIDGFELTRLIRLGEKSGAARLPIIAITANAMPGEPERCRAAGMDDYLSKPIEIKTLQAALERWLDPNWHPVSVGGMPPTTAPMPLLAVTPTQASVAPIDLRNLKTVFGDDPERLKPVLEQWRVVIDDAARELRAAVTARRWDEMTAAAHRIKGSAGIAGAHDLSASAVRLETALHTQDRAAIKREVASVLECAAGALRAIEAWNASKVAPASAQAAFSATVASSVSK